MVKIKINKKEKKYDQYPILKQCPLNDHIVLFTKKNTGTTLFPGATSNCMGGSNEYWAEENFVVFNDEIILKNEG